MSPDEQLELLRQFAPTLHFDALERWRPGLLDDYLRRSAVLDGRDRVLPATPPAEPAMNERGNEPKARLNPLRHGEDVDTQARSNEVLGAYGTDEGPGSAGTAYGRVAESGGGLFLQYWLFYPDNPCVLPPGRHDGDWELVQVRVERGPDGYRATQLTLAEHGKPVSEPLAADAAIDVFVAIDSHACYFTAGAKPMIPLSDVCEPAMESGAKPAVALLPIATSKLDWAHWRGRWGLDRGPGTLLALALHLERTPWPLTRLNKLGAGESPPSPGHQGQSWRYPRAFAARGTARRQTITLAQRLAHFLGHATWPKQPPRVRVAPAEPGRSAPASPAYAVEAEAAGRFLRRVTLVAIAFWEQHADGKRRALALHTVHPGEKATFTIKHEGELLWRAAGYNLLRQRSDPILPKPPQPTHIVG